MFLTLFSQRLICLWLTVYLCLCPPRTTGIPVPLAINETGQEALIPKLKAIFEFEGVPSQWVWIAEVESSFNPYAESPKGAKGLFQLMPQTAHRFGLSTDPIDERLDPRKSAHAAAKYLRILHEEFGSWELALAAYNAGEGRVRRLMAKHHARSFEEISFDLPTETRFYVEKALHGAKQRNSEKTATYSKRPS